MRKLSRILSGIILISAVLLLFTSCKYMKMDPPPDADKAVPIANNDNSCGLATAANMLAGAGYGTGATVLERADEIYNELVTLNNGLTQGEWIDIAISKWLLSTNNTWPNNPYRIITVYGNKSQIPWTNPNGAQFIGNELRRCQFVGLDISWPQNNSNHGFGGHAITAWGDDMGKGDLSANPLSVRVTDSDTDAGGDVQSYNYDAYNNPNPGGPNHGSGWYINYSNNHPFIRNITTLCPVDDPIEFDIAQHVVGSYTIHQSNEELSATDLHYTVRTDVDILTYKTTIDWTDKVSPTITEANPRRSITVDWDLKEHPVPYCTDVIITAEFVLPRWNAMHFENVHFTYPDKFDPTVHDLHKKPDLYWLLKTPEILRADQIPNVTGGYLVGGFDVINPRFSGAQQLIGTYRLLHEYSYDQDPELHEFMLSGSEGYIIENIRFGHSYGYLSSQELWEFEDWMTIVEDTTYFLSEEPFNITIDWEGRLPYPPVDVFPDEIRKEILEKQK